MSERTRIVLQGVVVLGAVVPFVLGAASQFLMPRIDRQAPAIESADGAHDDEKV
jgi:hypothetical protein